MIDRFKKLWSDTSGNALIMACAAMPLIVGSAGLATDTIQWALWKRQLQRTADSAAIAAVYGVIGGDTRDAAVARDMEHNGHLSEPGPTIAYLTPAAPFAADANAVRLRLSYSKRLTFSSFFLSTPPSITAEATATIVPSGEYCVVSLEEEAFTGINAIGSTTVNMGCGMVTNSPDDQAAVATGSSSVTASPMAAVGQIPAGNWGTGTVLQPFTLKQADPFASKTIPAFTGCGAIPNFKTGETAAVTNSGGTRCSTGDMTVQGTVVMEPGTYIFDGGSLKMTSTGSSLKCNECTFIFTNSSTATNATIGTVDLSGGTLDLSAPTSGPYEGMTIFQDRRATQNVVNKINGNSVSQLSGGFYFPRQELEFTGTAGLSTTCLMIASKRVSFKGNSSIDNQCPASLLDAFRGRRVRLVA